MAYWGMSAANANNAKRAAEFIKKAVALKDKASRREQLWISSLADYHAETKKPENERRQAFVKALEKLSFEFPDDVEAKAFLVCEIWENKGKGIAISSHQAVDALAKEVLAANPLHPVHHFRIHLWNHEDDRRALDSAARCGQAAPGIAHMWHMPGHTFTKLRRYADAAWQQEASARVDHAHMAAARILPEQIHNYAHNNDWLVENLGYIGRVRDALELARNMIELPRLAPKAAPAAGKRSEYDSGRSGSNMGRNRLIELALRYELWSELAALDGTTYLGPFGLHEDPLDETKRLRALGVAFYSLGNRAKGDEKLEAMEAEAREARDARLAAADDAEAKAKVEKKTPEETSKLMAEALLRFSKRVAVVDAALAELRLQRALAEGKTDEARKQIPLAKDLAPERLARIHLQLGDRESAEKSARDAVSKGEGQLLPLANLADVLWTLGKKPEAQVAFRKLRELAAQADLDTPVLARLEPIARALDLPTDWRPRLEFPGDSGARPDLATLGPFRWQPYEAPAWTLPDQTSRPVSLTGFHGRPVLLFFYLGSGCSHCIEQLNIFGPMTKAFADAGIDLVAVSTDTVDALHKTFAQADGGKGFPFPILADPGLGAFKAYRAFDDFENIALHGIFLIDGAGCVRWQDISYQPFRDAAWLLGESKRLLAMPVALPSATAAAPPAEGTP